MEVSLDRLDGLGGGRAGRLGALQEDAAHLGGQEEKEKPGCGCPLRPLAPGGGKRSSRPGPAPPRPACTGFPPVAAPTLRLRPRPNPDRAALQPRLDGRRLLRRGGRSRGGRERRWQRRRARPGISRPRHRASRALVDGGTDGGGSGAARGSARPSPAPKKPPPPHPTEGRAPPPSGVFLFISRPGLLHLHR